VNDVVQGSHGTDIVCSNKLKTYTDLTGFPTFPQGTKSLLSKYLSKDIW
jgi:protein-arginine kinase